jgi:hypothetical protein
MAERYKVKLDYIVMALAQKKIFVCGRNGRVHILLQIIWKVQSSVHCWQLLAALAWLATALLNPPSCFPFTFPLSRRFLPSHSNRTPHRLVAYDGCIRFICVLRGVTFKDACYKDMEHIPCTSAVVNSVVRSAVNSVLCPGNGMKKIPTS